MTRAAAHVRRGVELFNAGRPLDAAQEFAQAQRAGGGARAGCLRARSLHAAGRSREALSILSRYPRSGEALLARAEMLRALGRGAQERRILERAGALPRVGKDAAAALARSWREEALAAGRGPGAERAWRRLTELSPQDEEARAELLACARRRGDWAEALRLDPDDGESRRRLAEGLRAKAETLDSAPAAVLLERALLLDPSSADRTRALLAGRLRAAADVADASRRFAAGRALRERADRALPPPPKERAELFRALVRRNRYADAFREAERLLDGQPTLWDLRAFWAPWDVARLERDRPAHLRVVDALARGGASPWALYYRGFLRGGRPGADDFAALRRFDARRYGWMHGRAGQSCLQLGLLDRAVDHLTRALRYRPVDWRLRGFLAQARLAQGREAQAFAELDRAAKSAPREERAHVLAWRACVALWSGRYAQAAAAADRACALGAPYQRGLLQPETWRGAARLLRGDARTAVRLLDAALRAHPDDIEARLWRAEARRRLGRHRQALEDLDLRPGGLWADSNRALCHAALGEERRMRAVFARLPEAYRRKAAAASGWNSRAPATGARIVAALEAGLRLARGWRRDEEYGKYLWARPLK